MSTYLTKIRSDYGKSWGLDDRPQFRINLYTMTQAELEAERDALKIDIEMLEREEQQMYWMGRDSIEYWELRAELGNATYNYWQIKFHLSDKYYGREANMADME